MGSSLDSSLDHIVLVNNAKRALQAVALKLTYQPIYSVDHREVDSVETLLRWRISPGKLAAAQDFRSVFRDPMLSLSIRDFVLSTTLRQAGAGVRKGMISAESASMRPPSISAPGILPYASPTWCRISA